MWIKSENEDVVMNTDRLCHIDIEEVKVCDNKDPDYKKGEKYYIVTAYPTYAEGTDSETIATFNTQKEAVQFFNELAGELTRSKRTAASHSAEYGEWFLGDAGRVLFRVKDVIKWEIVPVAGDGDKRYYEIWADTINMEYYSIGMFETEDEAKTELLQLGEDLNG